MAKETTAFSTPDGNFEFNVKKFGLTNTTATFQWLMECVLAGLTTHKCLIYLDDIIIFSTSFPDHLARLRGWVETEPKQMPLREEGSSLPGSCHLHHRYQTQPIQNGSCFLLPGPNKPQRTPTVLGIGELLSSVHQRLLTHR